YPFRVALISIKEGGFILMTDKHHIISDGISQDVLLKDFWKLYKGENLPVLRLQYKDYAVWQKESAEKEIMLRHREYWLNAFKEEFDLLNLPIDYERPLIKSSYGANIQFEIDEISTEKLRNL